MADNKWPDIVMLGPVIIDADGYHDEVTAPDDPRIKLMKRRGKELAEDMQAAMDKRHGLDNTD